MSAQTMSLLDASARLGVSPATLYKWRNRGVIEIIPPQQAQVKVVDVERILAIRGEAGIDEGTKDAGLDG